MNKRGIFFLFLLFFSSLFALNNSEPLRFNPWQLIIYRPENNYDLNDVRCWLKAEDAETGEDVTYSKIFAKYEWVSNTKIIDRDPTQFKDLFVPDRTTFLYEYKKTYYLSGGMAMYLLIKPGKYKFSIYTPKDKTNLYETENKGDWLSNELYYDTENPTKVLFVSPTANDNGFYNGGWYLSYNAPEFYKFTKPKMN